MADGDGPKCPNGHPSDTNGNCNDKSCVYGRIDI